MNIYIIVLLIITAFMFGSNVYAKQAIINGNELIIKKKNNYKKNAVIFLGVILILITGLRSPEISADYSNYDYIFRYTIKSLTWKKILLGREPLFNLLMKIVGELTDYNVVILMLAVSAITVYFLLKYFYIETVNPIFCIFLLVSIGSYYTSFNTTRQYLAAALYVVAFKYACKRNLKKYLLTVVAISLIHFTALAMIPFYWLLNIRWNKVKNIGINLLILLLIVVIFFEIGNVINSLVNIYYFNIDSNNPSLYEASINPLNVLRPLLIYVIAVMFRKKLNLENAKENCLLNTSFFFLVFYLYSYRVTLFIRFTYFFIPGSLVMLDRIISRVNKDNRKIIYWLLFAFCIAWNIMGIFQNEYLFYWE